MTVAFGMVVFAVALITIEIFVHHTTVGGDRPGLGHGSASVALEAQSAPLEVNLREAHLVKEGNDVGVTPIVAAPWP